MFLDVLKSKDARPAASCDWCPAQLKAMGLKASEQIAGQRPSIRSHCVVHAVQAGFLAAPQG